MTANIGMRPMQLFRYAEFCIAESSSHVGMIRLCGAPHNRIMPIPVAATRRHVYRDVSVAGHRMTNVRES